MIFNVTARQGTEILTKADMRERNTESHKSLQKYLFFFQE